MRRLIIILILILIVAAVYFVAGDQILENLPNRQVEEAPSYDTVVVNRDTIASTVSGTGNIEPEAEVSLSFRGTGRVETLLVTAGQRVVVGQLLAELETTDLALALAQAKVSREISELQLAKLDVPPDQDEITTSQAAVAVAQANVAGAEASIVSAQAAYNDLLAGPTQDQQTVNLAQVRQAEANLKTAQQAYDQVKSRPDIGMLPQSAELERATNALEVAKSQGALTDQPPTQAQLASALNQIAQAEVGLRQAQSNLISAQNNLKNIIEGPKIEDIEIARAQLRQAQLNELQAENNLKNSRIVAPFDGVISQVNVEQGEFATGGPAIILTDLARFHMTVQVDEIDVRQLQVGQEVAISIDALPDSDLTGRVTKVSPTASDVGGVVAYEVTIVPDPSDAPLRAGMSATAIITTAKVENVIVLPNRYIRLDRDAGRAYVNKMQGNEPVLQEIELGLRSERQSQILAGLTDGDSVALILTSSEEELRGALFGGGN